MNKKISIEIAIGIIILFALAVGGYIWTQGQNVGAPNMTAPTVKKSMPKIETPVVSNNNTSAIDTKNNPLEYINSEFGFQLILPTGWENYKTDVDRNQIKTTSEVYVHIFIPTTDKAWPVIAYTKGLNFDGYADVAAIEVDNISNWNKQCNGYCKKSENADTPPCSICTSFVAKSDKYVFSISQAQDLPEDLLNKNIYGDVFQQTMKDNFKLSTANASAQNNAKVYVNTDFGFQLTPPAGWQINSTASGDIGGTSFEAVPTEKSNIMENLGFGISIFKSTESPKNWYADNYEDPVNLKKEGNYAGNFKDLTINESPAFYVDEIKDAYTEINYVISNGNEIIFLEFREKGNGQSYESYLPVFNAMANSLEFTK